MIRKLFIYALTALFTLSLASCYNDFEEPAVAKVWSAQDFNGSHIVSIKFLKDMFDAKYGTGSNSLAQTLVIEDDYVISGKVISSDRAGNVYKSLYIYDESSQSAIELKLTVSNYVDYQLGQTIFVKCKGLALGSYRYMVSLGAPPSVQDIANGYANSNIEDKVQLDAHIFEGAQGTLTAADTLVVNASNYRTLTDASLGRLVRFEGLQYNAGSFDGDIYPNFLEVTYPNNSTTGVYTTKYYSAEGLTPTYAYSYNNNRYYGSSWFGYADASQNKIGNYIVRVSGYSNFSLQPLPSNGATGSITAIYTKYSAKNGNYIKYQLLLNSFSDVAGF